MSPRRTPSTPGQLATLVAVLLTVALCAASPLLGTGIGLAATRICMVSDAAPGAADFRGPLTAKRISAAEAPRPAATPMHATLALRAAILLHTTALPPPAAC